MKQLAQIKHHKAHLCHINTRLPKNNQSRQFQQQKGLPVPISSNVHHHIGISQNNYEHVGTFLQQCIGDPVIQVHTYLIVLAK